MKTARLHSVPPLREAREPSAASAYPTLRVDPGLCDGVGICAHLAPDLVALDSWGYPVVTQHPLARAAHRRQAEAAVTACPRKALHLQG